MHSLTIKILQDEVADSISDIIINTFLKSIKFITI